MNEGGGIAQTILNINPRFLNFFYLDEFNRENFLESQEFTLNRSRNSASKGLQYAVKLINYSKYQLADFKENFLKGNAKASYISRKAGELHQLIDQIESLEERIRRENVPFIKAILNTSLAKRGIERLFKGGHDLTSLAESCTMHILESLSEFDLRKSVKDYFSFVESKVEEKIEEISFQENKKILTWLELENFLKNGICSDTLLSNLPPRQKEIIIRLYGLDKKLPESIDDLANRFEVPEKRVKVLEMAALTKLAIVIDPIGFRDKFYAGKTRKEIERKNRAFWRYLKDNNILVSSQRKNYGNDPIEIYNKKYPGVSRGKLVYIDNPLYQALKYHNQLYLVPVTRSDLVKPKLQAN